MHYNRYQNKSEDFNPEVLALQSFNELKRMWQCPTMDADRLGANIGAAIAWGPITVDVVRESDIDAIEKEYADFLAQYGVEIHGVPKWPARSRVVLRRLVECPGEYQGNYFIGVTQQQSVAA